MVRQELFDEARHADMILSMALRKADRDEFLASSGQTNEAVLKAAKKSTACFVVFNGDDELVGVYGYIDLGNGHASVWGCGTESGTKEHKFLFRTIPEWLDSLLNKFNRLVGFVDSRNTRHIAWLRRVGFVVDSKRRLRRGDVDFWFFEKAWKGGSR